MASILHTLGLTLFIALLLSPTFAADPPEFTPSPSPQQAISPSPSSPAHSPALPPSPISPNSPSPEDDYGASSEQKKSPSPAPDVAADADQRNQSHTGDLERKDDDDDSGGMNGGQKAGIAFGVIAGGCLVAFGSMVYKRRQENIRRAQYGFPARSEFL